MLTGLRFLNWRSLRDVTIEGLTPLTIFIGANASGKTNILDALHFVRYTENAGGSEAAFVWRMKDKVRTIGASMDSPVELEFTYSIDDKSTPLTKTSPIVQKYSVSFQNDSPSVKKETLREPPGPPDEKKRLLEQISSFVSLRWQLLREGFLPPSTLAADANPAPGNLYIIDPLARDVPSILNFMQQLHPQIYQSLEADLQLLLGYVSQLRTHRDDKETRYFVEEKFSLGHEAPTVSAGTARILAMLTAYYALDMRYREQPGLVVIEDPDTAIHPLLLGNLVDLLRSYTERDVPRQFVLTTHNPQMLDYFKPEEVRVVERDPDTGNTWVEMVPEHLNETWLHSHSLGEAWMSRIIGGIPEE